MLHIVLFQPEIPPNTGNVIRLAANTGTRLHLIKPLGFSIDDKQVRRAGLDYHEVERVSVHESWEEFLTLELPGRIFALSTKGTKNYADTAFRAGDILVFGPETRGLPASLREALPSEQVLRVPMREGSRSLNLSNSVAIVVYEALRQMNFKFED
ncbi:MAG: tRNA (uridine(34)/cytosine(34)/5-carboxymethylaminomethyluridine(34)-2'-O)-methyltransferase TrmL [Gammaproteobacteria bacterium]|nr:tRNA (uridine(34)/cytosine(34)/5-carboxymethylaminomethyluridine(34)-2'-O)-methyltransferase TrmL [Gammaproteobacteria bacterium]MDP2139938.1 tRNA (uridine(34)/cytosine(34)/5-carboxymethylaminomethyluridine(34)-2'-O)-methyltransferase TrmL [Gammaproteobacteria bacterium]MDP2347758.1 tRNA (uridine(34)/cytosine(34)/5-carboxymethylaminomethyluridine(34)-2'-O)-methyltransferase TrmL [Gammaproteobacteria bacterium]